MLCFTYSIQFAPISGCTHTHMFIYSLQAVILRHPLPDLISYGSGLIHLLVSHCHFCFFSYYNRLSISYKEEKKFHLTQFQREKHICYHKKYKFLLYFRHINWISIKIFSSPDIGICSHKGYWLPCTNTPVLVLTLSACFTYHANIFSKTQSVVCHLHNHCPFTILNSYSIAFIRLPTKSPLQHTDCHIHLNFWSREKKPEARILAEPHTHL